MRAIDHEPQAWYLLEDRLALYLVVSCSHGIAGYLVLIELNAAEMSAYEAEGRVYIDRLADDIYRSDPGAVGSPSPFKSRNLNRGPGELMKRVIAAALAWPERQ